MYLYMYLYSYKLKPWHRKKYSSLAVSLVDTVLELAYERVSDCWLEHGYEFQVYLSVNSIPIVQSCQAHASCSGF